MLRLNPQSEWVKVDVPELRIIDDDLWQAVKERQAALAKAYAKQVTASRNAITKALNATHRPRTLLSGLLVCGCCGGSYARRGQDRYACITHVRSGGCDNGRTNRPRGAGSPRTGGPQAQADGARDRSRGHASLRGRDQSAQPRAAHQRRDRPQGACRHRTPT